MRGGLPCPSGRAEVVAPCCPLFLVELRKLAPEVAVRTVHADRHIRIICSLALSETNATINVRLILAILSIVVVIIPRHEVRVIQHEASLRKLNECRINELHTNTYQHQQLQDSAYPKLLAIKELARDDSCQVRKAALALAIENTVTKLKIPL